MRISLFASTLVATVALHACTKKAPESKPAAETAPPAVVAEPSPEISAPSAPEPDVEAAGSNEAAPSEPAATTPSDAKAPTTSLEEAAQHAETAVKDLAIESKDVVEQSMATALSAVDAKIAELSSKAQTKGDAAKKTLEGDLADLKAKREVAARELAKLKESSAESWTTLKDGAQKAFEQLEAALEKAEQGVTAH